ncbi:MAG: carbohydrate ABC transporter substrate-binding protein [Anaerolineae bacterium]|nr:carbohydrate ABC transporter substrate-binding protein [Anaerolineae bacterium]MBN8618147.1 carbohydrate ABC transporter substrate-binding protein [Anaerolineae bacterium]
MVVVVLALVMALSLTGLTTAQDVSGDLEIFSWWTGGGEAAGLDALIAKFTEMYPGVNIINSAVAGGSGVNARAVLTTRMLGGDPPDTFQVHAGAELNTLWVKAGRMEPLNDLFEANGWLEQYPEGLLSLISDAEGNIYSVPVNIHRSNVLWYVPGNLEQWGVTVPADWNEFVDTTCPALLAKDVTPIAVGQTWTQAHLWESVALAGLGADGYNGLWNGQTSWTSPEVNAVWDTFGKILDCANSDLNALTWQDASKLVIDGAAAFNVMGDWAAGYYLVDNALEPGTGFAWAASPGTDGVFMMLSDTFGLPKGAPHPDNVRAWLSFIGSAEAQDIFNPLKGSLPANTSAQIGDAALYNAYFQDAYEDWTTNAIVGSQAHGAVAPAAFSDGFLNIIASFQSTKDGVSASAAAAALAIQTGIGG